MAKNSLMTESLVNRRHVFTEDKRRHETTPRQQITRFRLRLSPLGFQV